MKKTIREALIIALITLLLTVVYCALSPDARILLKKGLGIKTAAAMDAATPAVRGTA